MSAATQGGKKEVGREAGSRRWPEKGPDAGAGHSQSVRADMGVLCARIAEAGWESVCRKLGC
jgi:hypothetical protein